MQSPGLELGAPVNDIVRQFRADRVVGGLLGRPPAGSIEDIRRAGVPLSRVISLAWGPVSRRRGDGLGPGHAVIQETVKMHRDQRRELPRHVGTAYCNRGVLVGAVIVEGVRLAIEQHGPPRTGDKVRRGCEAIRGFDLQGAAAPAGVHAEGPEGRGHRRISRATGQARVPASGWSRADRDEVMALVRKANGESPGPRPRGRLAPRGTIGATIPIRVEAAMRRARVALVLLAPGLLAGLLASRSAAGPDRIAFPAAWKDHVLYATVDRHDVKQYRELYASSQEAVQAMREGRPLPYGTVLTLVQYRAQVDAQGAPVRDGSGRFVKGDLIAYTVMEKRQGWGSEYPDDLRNGEWEYAAFGPDTRLNEKANYRACFQCHKPHERQDFVISLASLKGGGGGAGGVADVTIANFAFGPGTLTAAPGRPVTWVNRDDSPHQITVTTGAQSRGPVLTRGQSYTRAFAEAGTYDYICGLHPNMKGRVEVR